MPQVQSAQMLTWVEESVGQWTKRGRDEEEEGSGTELQDSESVSKVDTPGGRMQPAGTLYAYFASGTENSTETQRDQATIKRKRPKGPEAHQVMRDRGNTAGRRMQEPTRDRSAGSVADRKSVV